MKYTNHSGGCPGADMTWETEGYNYGVETISYSFYNHVQYGKNQYKLNEDEIAEGWFAVTIADVTLNRNAHAIEYSYVKNLLCRNYHQVKHSDTVFAIGVFEDSDYRFVQGGTGWTVQMAIDSYKPVFLFDQTDDMWYFHNGTQESFVEFHDIPILTNNFAGVGTRNINEAGIHAIKEILKYNLGENNA